MVCGVSGAPHHADCWNSNGGCAVAAAGLVGEAGVAPTPAPAVGGGASHMQPVVPPAPPMWLQGAGAAFPAGWSPAWKVGWGGSRDDPPHFLAGQVVVLHLGAVPVAATAIFVPRHEPSNDNPRITEAPEALENIFRAARVGLEEE
jgi:hypothetical protein